MLLHNLISNALSHTPGHVLIKVDSDRVSICDEGGASAVVCPTVAEREAAEQRPEGLGLYICTLVCERYGWQFGVEQAGSGQCVMIRFSDSAPV